MAKKFEMYKRNMEWWREDGEQPDGTRLTEAYEASRLKAGTDGKGVKSLQKGRVGTDSEDFGKKGVNEKKLGKKPVREEFEDEMDADPEMGMGDEDMGGDLGDDLGDDLPPDLDDSDDMIDDGMGDGSEVAEDVTVTIGGQTFKLVPVEGDDMGGDEGLAGEAMDGEDMGDMGDIDNMDGDEIEAEDDDVTKPMESAKKQGRKVEGINYEAILDRAIAEANSKREKVAQYRKSMGKKVREDEIAKSGKTASGTKTSDSSTTMGNPAGNVSNLGKDDAFSVDAIASSGKAYTPSASSGTYESVKKAELALKKAYKEWKKVKAMSEEISPDEQTAPKGTADSIDDDFANLPIAIGADPKVVERMKATKAKRDARKQESEQKVQFPSDEVKEDLDRSLNESFDYKKLLRGDYKN